ncbi:V-set and transmembrane domain-containing protein 2B [Pundamilia nyererei]|uniref:V-set and transmembrane domain-containing protein 2B n=1 Tax=Pundamilia nyererei TaxID=303518 RepID=A0A9Y3VV73_9CICH|nr:PREDICTED: V-set and transmembrane domain-containing protein 2B [Pundamilia nyererei]
MEKTGLDGILYCFLINSACMICANATFTEVPKDVSVGEGDDVEMPCAFKAVSSAPMSLEIQWWYLKKDMSEDELQITAPANRAKDVSREATKISTVRVQGNAISHSLSLSKVKKKDEGVYECRVSDLWADESQEFNVHATLHVTLADSMVAEEAVSHIQNRGSLRNTITALGGASSWRATSEPRKNFAGGQMPGLGKQRVSQESQLGLLSPFISTTSVARSSASPLSGDAGILRQQYGADCSVMSTMDRLLCITLVFMHKLLPLLLAH